jgi:large subunit ribosomal protein L7Ae
MASIYELVEKVRKTGKIEKGINEVTKAIERGTAKLVVIAKDVSPVEITQHIPILCKEKGIICEEADSKEKLGIAVGIKVPCSSTAIIETGEAELPKAKIAKEPVKEKPPKKEK